MKITKNQLKSLIISNRQGITAYLKRLFNHDGNIQVQYLHQVVESDNQLRLDYCHSDYKIQNSHSLLIGLEVCNSFSPLYEITSFFRALFLSAIGSVFLKQFESRIGSEYQLCEQEIDHFLANLDKDKFLTLLHKPDINIICGLDTDIEPYRYVKHHLWRLEEDSLKKRCYDIFSDDLSNPNIDLSLKDIYWIEQDQEIANQAILNGTSLPKIKAVQFYLTLKHILKKIDIDINNVPLFFNLAPKEELMILGDNSDILQIILNLHNEKFKKIYSKILQTRTPWILAFSCPQCSESSKRIINARLDKNCKTVSLICSHNPKSYRNELGTNLIRKGCGYRWKVTIPNTTSSLYELLKNNSFTLSCSVRELMRIINSTSHSIIAYVGYNLGLEKRQKEYEFIPNLPKGYGDHRYLMTSVLAMQKMLVDDLMLPEISKKLKNNQLLKSQEAQLLVCASPNQLRDKTVFCMDNRELNVTDTSALKIIKQWMSVEEMFIKSIDIYAISLEQLLELRGLSFKDLTNLVSD